MKDKRLQSENTRRAFINKLAVGSLSGFAVGSVIAADDDKAKDLPIILQDPNVCRGLNTCKGKGKGDHECAGQGSCATVEKHSCSGSNECKGQGGCGTTAGENKCKGQGDCAVPLKKKTWESARAAFEKAADKHAIKYGDAPAKG